MSALAQVLLAGGLEASGSDRHLDAGRKTPLIARLEGAGLRFMPQDGSGVASGTACVIVSTAIEEDNPDVIAASRLGVRVVHRTDVLAELTTGKRCVAVTGTSGKSTVAGMIGWILEQEGMDPVVVNGAPVIDWITEACPGNARCGRSDLWVLEADESDRSLLKFSPDIAVITNESKDHFGLEETSILFREFAGRAREAVIDGRGPHGVLGGFQPSLCAGGSSFTHAGTGFSVPLMGRHNAENAMIAVLACERLGVEAPGAARALAGFRGISRRLETLGTGRGVTVVDDYAHNPAKIRAAWQSVAAHGTHVLGLWRPHGFAPLAGMMEDLENTFCELVREGDAVYILPVYDAGGTADRSVGSGELVERISRRGVNAFSIDGYEEARDRIVGAAKPGDVVLTMGARDPEIASFASGLLETLAPAGRD